MTRKLFFIILLLAFFLRFYRLGQNPPSLDWDEVSNAYNAYSILKTGRDEYGAFLPLTNRSFDDYKPPLYMYLNVFTVAIFGLTPFSARLPAAFLGLLTVPTVYLLTKKLFENSKAQLVIGKLELDIPIVAMALLALSPWHLQFSRVGFEATVGLFLATTGVTAFLYGLTNKKWLVAAGLFLGLSLYSYHAERIFVPLLFIATFFIWRKQILAVSKKYLIIFLAIPILFGLALLIWLSPKVIFQRYQATTATDRITDIDKSIKFILQDQNLGLKFANIIHNRRVIIGQTMFGNYLSHFDLNFLFTKGDDNFRHHVEGMGMLYLFELPLMLYGIFRLIKDKTKEALFLILWLVISPISASPVGSSPHAVRSLTMVVALEIIAAYALISFFSQKFSFRRIALFGFLTLILISFFIYLHNYWIHYPKDFAYFWQYGYREAVLESEKIKNDYEKINIDSSIEQAYIFWLFNTKYDPAVYQKQGNHYHFDKYYFTAPKPSNSQELYIAAANKFPDDFEVIKTIYYPDGTEAIKIGHSR